MGWRCGGDGVGFLYCVGGWEAECDCRQSNQARGAGALASPSRYERLRPPVPCPLPTPPFALFSAALARGMLYPLHCTLSRLSLCPPPPHLHLDLSLPFPTSPPSNRRLPSPASLPSQSPSALPRLTSISMRSRVAVEAAGAVTGKWFLRRGGRGMHGGSGWTRT